MFEQPGVQFLAVGEDNTTISLFGGSSYGKAYLSLQPLCAADTTVQVGPYVLPALDSNVVTVWAVYFHRVPPSRAFSSLSVQPF